MQASSKNVRRDCRVAWPDPSQAMQSHGQGDGSDKDLQGAMLPSDSTNRHAAPQKQLSCLDTVPAMHAKRADDAAGAFVQSSIC